jgi:hypothetical protein
MYTNLHKVEEKSERSEMSEMSQKDTKLVRDGRKRKGNEIY